MAKRGRPPGKHSDPNYTLVGAYVHRSVYEAVKKKLAAEDADFSQLVEKLFADWLVDNEAEQPTAQGQATRLAGRDGNDLTTCIFLPLCARFTGPGRSSRLRDAAGPNWGWGIGGAQRCAEVDFSISPASEWKASFHGKTVAKDLSGLLRHSHSVTEHSGKQLNLSSPGE